MGPTLKITKPEEIGPIEKISELVELPFVQNGKKPVFQIRPLSGSDLVRIRAMDQDEAVEGALAAAVIQPALSFGEAREAGKLWWNDLLPGNQEGLLKAINRASGIGQGPDAEAAKRTVTFPDEPRGRGDGAAPAAPVRAAEVAA